MGGILVVVVLFLFLFDLRTAAISCTAIPLSLLAATLVLDRMGASLNTMTLGGLAIAIGVVVDDAVIDVENIVRRLAREPEDRPSRSRLRAVVLDATLEVRGAVVYATFAVILVVLPVMTLSGTVGTPVCAVGSRLHHGGPGLACCRADGDTGAFDGAPAEQGPRAGSTGDPLDARRLSEPCCGGSRSGHAR